MTKCVSSIERAVRQLDDRDVLQPILALGEVVEMSGDCYGDAVNVSARLLDHAGDNETLVTGEVLQGLTLEQRSRFRSLDRLVLRGASVVMTNPALHGQGIRFGIPDIELRDLGKRQGGLTASEIGNIVAAELEARIAQKVLTNIELLKKGGVEGAIDALKGLLR